MWVSFGFFSSPDSRATYEFVSGLSRDGDFSSALQRGIRVFLSAGRSTSGVSGQDSGAAMLSAPDEGWAPGQALPSAQSVAQGLWVPPEIKRPWPASVIQTFTRTSERSSRALVMPAMKRGFRKSKGSYFYSPACQPLLWPHPKCSSFDLTHAGWPWDPAFSFYSLSSLRASTHSLCYSAGFSLSFSSPPDAVNLRQDPHRLFFQAILSCLA